MTDKLLPCPFCGGKAELVEGEECAYVQCLDMKMHRAMFVDGDNNAAAEAKEQWNLRAALAAAPQPAPDREALVGVIAKVFRDVLEQHGEAATPSSRQIADALLARGLRLPGKDDTMQQLADLGQQADRMAWDESKLRDIAYRMLAAKVLPELSELLELRDYLEIPEVDEATALGVELSDKGYSRQSDIRGDEYDDAHAALLMRALRVAIRVVEGGDDA